MDIYPRKYFPKVDYTGMTANQAGMKKMMSPIGKKKNKSEQWHMRMSDQDFKTIEYNIYHTETLTIIADRTMIQTNHWMMK